MSDRYPGMRILGTDAATTEVSSSWTMPKPAQIASDSEIRESIKSAKQIAAYAGDEWLARVAILEGELALRAQIAAGVALPNEDRQYANTWHKDTRTWNPSKAVYAVRTHSMKQGDRSIDLGYGSISNPLDTPAQAIRFAQYFRSHGWEVEPVAVPCLFSAYEDHISLDNP